MTTVDLYNLQDELNSKQRDALNVLLDQLAQVTAERDFHRDHALMFATENEVLRENYTPGQQMSIVGKPIRSREERKSECGWLMVCAWIFAGGIACGWIVRGL